MTPRTLYITENDKKRLEELAGVAKEFGSHVRKDIESLVKELERAVIAGIRKAQARSAATLADLGIDSAELGEWGAERVEKGRWPEGDLLEAFRAWRSQKNTSNADPFRQP